MIEHPTASGKAALDEESFTRLLAAAYVMQEHQDRVRAKVSPADLTQIISQVVDTQHEIQNRSLRGDSAFQLVAKRLASLTSAAGVAIAIQIGDTLRYCAGSGSAESTVGSEIPKLSALAAVSLRTGTAFQSPLAQTDPRLNSTQCRKLGVQSLLVVPLFHEGQVSGAIEMYFSQISGFGESETRAAELMAGVASEIIAEAAEQKLKEELESERASALQALEMLEPDLQKIVAPPLPESTNSIETNPQSELCRACGHAFVGNESSCGVCGASRATGMYPGAALQSKWAVLWERHLSGAEQGGMPLFRKTPPRETSSPLEQRSDFPGQTAHMQDSWQQPVDDDPDLDGNVATSKDLASELEGDTESALVISPSSPALQSKALPGITRTQAAWQTRLRAVRERPGDACLALAAAVLAITLIWALWPGRDRSTLANAHPPTVSAVRRHPRPRPPQLSLFEEALVGLGLAVPPPTPEYLGDPNVKVWEDLQTGLYYCPDADLYGTTSKGSYTTQAEAQQDAFEPAFRKPCD